MKLYVMDGGVGCTPREIVISTGAPIDPTDMVDIPTMMILIDHPDGKILYDTGWSQAERDNFPFTIKEEENVLNRLKALGVEPDDIKTVIISHLHVDHAGYLEFFPNAEVIVSEPEFNEVMKLYNAGELGTPYNKLDADEWMRIGMNWKLIGDEGSVVPVADGVSVLSLGIGHAFGMLALLVELEKEGNVLITSDAIYCQENVGPPVKLPGGILDADGYIKSFNRIMEVAEEYNAKLWFGHDMEQFATLKKSTEGFYE